MTCSNPLDLECQDQGTVWSLINVMEGVLLCCVIGSRGDDNYTLVLCKDNYVEVIVWLWAKPTGEIDLPSVTNSGSFP